MAVLASAVPAAAGAGAGTAAFAALAAARNTVGAAAFAGTEGGRIVASALTASTQAAATGTRRGIGHGGGVRHWFRRCCVVRGLLNRDDF